MTTHKTRTTDSKYPRRAAKTKTAAHDKRAGDDLEQGRLVLAKVAYGHKLTPAEKRRLRKIQSGFGLDGSVTGWEKGETVQIPSLRLPGVKETHHLTKRGLVITEFHFPEGMQRPLDLTGQEFTNVLVETRAEFEARRAREKIERVNTAPVTGDRQQLKKMPMTAFRGAIFDTTNKGNFPLEDTAPSRASLETPGISGAEDEGLLNESLRIVLKSWGIPETMHRQMAAKLKRIAKEDAKAALRPKWDERGKYAELKDLSAPQFLKRVYADEIGRDGSIEKETVRKVDPKLMASVESYISEREKRKRDLGQAAGLRLIAGVRSRPKRATAT